MKPHEAAVIAHAIRWNETRNPKDECEQKLSEAVEALLATTDLKKWDAKLRNYESQAVAPEQLRLPADATKADAPRPGWRRLSTVYLEDGPTCAYRPRVDGDDDFMRHGPACGKLATFFDCSVTDMPVCAEHRCRCRIPIPSRASEVTP